MKFLRKLLNLLTSRADDGIDHSESAGRSHKAPGQIVLGQGLADAQEAEHRHQQSHANGTSPMPADQYESWRGDFDLFDLEPLPLDAEIRKVCHAFREASTEQQRAMRDAMSIDDFYTLLYFGKRGSVQAIRSEDVSIAVDGLTAIAMIDAERIDSRDKTMSLGLLDYALQRLGVNANESIEQASRLAVPEIAEILLYQTKRPANQRRLSSWCYEERQSSRGIGFVDRGIDPYAPLSDLFPIAADIAKVMNGDTYRAEVQLASSMPPVWLKGHDDRAVSDALASVTGGVTIRGELISENKEKNPHRFAQTMIVFLIETGGEEYANKLLAISKLPAKMCFRLGTASGKIFALMVAGSGQQAIEDFESEESLLRFEAPLQRALDRRD